LPRRIIREASNLCPCINSRFSFKDKRKTNSLFLNLEDSNSKGSVSQAFLGDCNQVILVLEEYSYEIV